MTTKEIAVYAKNPNVKHQFYKQNCDFAYDLRKHINGEYPKELIDDARPGESELVKKYRQKIYKPKTKRAATKVLNALQKIRKSQDWKIDYEQEINSAIAEGESLKDYMEVNFPMYTSFTNYTFSVALRYMAYDANAFTLWMPENVNKQENEYYRPMPVIFTSEQVIDHIFSEDNETVVLLSREKVKDGAVYYVVDRNMIQRFEQVKSDYLFKESWVFEHNLGILPLAGMWGSEFETAGLLKSYTSKLNPMVADLDEAAREYSDHQIEIILHTHQMMWVYNNQECVKCKGTGQIPVQNEAPITCESCKGTGKPPFNPFEYFSVKANQVGEQQVPVPPAGYIQKDTAITELQDKRIRDHIHDALSAIGMEILDAVPLNQSGTAKEIDRSEPDAFINSFAEDLVRYMDDCYFIVNEYRYKDLIQDAEAREENLPTINVPQKFDLITSGMIMQEINTLVTSKANASFVRSSTIDLINKKYDTDNEEREILLAKVELDPFAGQQEEVLAQQLLNGGISKVKYTIHCNISDYVDRLVEENPEWEQMGKKELTDILIKYAQEDMTVPDTGASKLMTAIEGGGQ